MMELKKVDGITVLDHGQQRVPPDKWQLAVVIRDPRAAAALRARGVHVERGAYPTAAELKDDLPDRR
jgi:hypothetical protein